MESAVGMSIKQPTVINSFIQFKISCSIEMGVIYQLKFKQIKLQNVFGSFSTEIGTKVKN